MASMTRRKEPACDAWQLLVQFLFVQRAHLPPVAAELELSPAQCHVLHLIEPGRPIPMGQLAEKIACDASNVTGLVDRLESRVGAPANDVHADVKQCLAKELPDADGSDLTSDV